MGVVVVVADVVVVDIVVVVVVVVVVIWKSKSTPSPRTKSGVLRIPTQASCLGVTIF